MTYEDDTKTYSSNQRDNLFISTTLDSDLAVGTLTSVPYSYTYVFRIQLTIPILAC